MTYTATYGLGPSRTPGVIKYLILITCSTSILAALLAPLFHTVFAIQGLQELFSLSWYGLSNYYFWQPITALFVQPAGIQGVSLDFLVELLFNMYIMWIMGTALIERVGETSFLKFYFTVGILAELFTLCLMPIAGHYTVIAGTTAVMLGIWTAWTMMHPDGELLVFFIIPVKAKWLLTGVLGVIVLINISRLNFITLSFCLGGSLLGYLYAVIAWGLEAPFHSLLKIDRTILRLIGHDQTNESLSGQKTKIIDFYTGQALLNDDAFIDAMLTKISTSGEQSLSWSERNRMRKISERKYRDRS